MASVDVVEDLYLYQRAELENQLGTGGLAKDMVESAYGPSACATWPSGQATFQSGDFAWASSPRASKLHKLHHVFQI
jgi:hypothetical protein